MDSIIGISTKNWWRLLVQNKFAIDPVPLFWLKAIAITAKSIRNSARMKEEERIYAKEIAAVNMVHPPIFILGHWRSGTTLLQNLMLLDKQFAFPSVFQCNYPFTFLSIEPKIRRIHAQSTMQARPMDEVKVSLFSPGEEEFALAVLTLMSPLLAWVFPRREQFYDRYLTFEQVNQHEVNDWKEAFIFFLRKLTYRYNRQLLLKSPPNTGRVRLLLEMFPDAKFIHIHRNPYVVFQSTMRLYQKALSNAMLQRSTHSDLASVIIRRYDVMYRSYFEQRQLIPPQNLIEIQFEALEADKIGTVERIYHQLNLRGFSSLKPNLEDYVRSIADYQKNKHPELPDALKQQIATAWRTYFETWGYSV